MAHFRSHCFCERRVLSRPPCDKPEKNIQAVVRARNVQLLEGSIRKPLFGHCQHFCQGGRFPLPADRIIQIGPGFPGFSRLASSFFCRHPLSHRLRRTALDYLAPNISAACSGVIFGVSMEILPCKVSNPEIGLFVLILRLKPCVLAHTLIISLIFVPVKPEWVK